MNSFLKDALSLIKNYKWNSIFFKYFKAILFIFFIPSCIFIVLFVSMSFSSIKATINTNQRYSIIKSVTQYDKAFDKINTIWNTINTSELTPELVKNSNPDYRYYSSYLKKLRDDNAYINSISVYIPKQQFVVSSYASDTLAEFRDTSWLSTYKDGMAEFSAAAKPKSIENSQQINFCKSLIVDGRNAGLIIFTLDGAVLTELMYAGEGGKTESIFLFNNNDVLIYSSNPKLYLENQEGIAKMMETASYKSEATYSTKKYQFNSIASGNHTYKLAVGLNLEAYNKNYSQLTSATILYLFLILLLVFIISLVIAFTFYRSIVDVVTRTSAASEDFTDGKENNELMYLGNTVLNTIKNHERIENELVEKISKLKKVQSIALQTQINPHFLFNTLNLVNGFILEESHGDSKAATMLSNLSDILYIALNTQEHIVTLANELEYAKKYLDIEQAKYPGKFHVNFDIDPDTLKCKTVKFVLQPIIENAIEHGVKKLNDNSGEITVSSSIINKKLVLSVSDNGPQISEEQMKILEARLESDEIQETRHIGLSNVNQRIKLIFGEEYGVSIYSDNTETIIDIIMPEI